MNRRLFLAASACVPVMGARCVAARGADNPAAGLRGNTDRGTTPAGMFDVVAQFEGPGPSGVAVTDGGRIFVRFPRHAIDHAGATLGELRNGKIIPYPSPGMSLPSSRAPAERFLSIHGITLDGKGRLWVIDDGKRAGHPIPEGGAKVVCIDPETGRIVHRIVLRAPVLLPDSHMNDLRVALGAGAAGTVFVTDSSFGTRPGLVIIDLARGSARRVLTHHPSAQPVAGFAAFVEGVPRQYRPHHPGMVSGGIDGIALTPANDRLFFSPLTSRRLYSAPVASLIDPALDAQALGETIRDEGEKGVADGLCFDRFGRLYTTDYEHDSILRRDRDGTLTVMARDPRILSPDGICATQTHIYCTLGQWNRLPSFNDGHDLRKPPYLLIRLPIEAPQDVSAEP